MQRRIVLLLGFACAVTRPAFALYEEKPVMALSVVQGEWRGSLTYRDYSEPRRLVRLPTRVFVALSAPSELVLHYVFDDGPSKTVFSYEKMSFGFEGHQVAWTTGPDAKTVICSITSDTTNNGVRALVFEQSDGADIKRFTMILSARALMLAEDEVSATGVISFRNKFDLSRAAP